MKRKLFFLLLFCSLFFSFSTPAFAGTDSILRSNIVLSKGNMKDSAGFQYVGSDIGILSEKMEHLYKLCQ